MVHITAEIHFTEPEFWDYLKEQPYVDLVYYGVIGKWATTASVFLSALDYFTSLSNTTLVEDEVIWDTDDGQLSLAIPGWLQPVLAMPINEYMRDYAQLPVPEPPAGMHEGDTLKPWIHVDTPAPGLIGYDIGFGASTVTSDAAGFLES